MFDKNYVEEVMSESIGTEHWYRRAPFQGFVYTDGVMNVQEKLNMYWFVDMVASYMPDVIKDFNKTGESFYVAVLKVNKDHTAKFKIQKEVEDDNCTYIEIKIAEQDIKYTDLPECEMRFFLELADCDPVTFCLLCPSEH